MLIAAVFTTAVVVTVPAFIVRPVVAAMVPPFVNPSPLIVID